MAHNELKKEIKDLKEEVKKIKELFESKGPVEYLEYSCPICPETGVKGQFHKIPRIRGTKHYLHMLQHSADYAIYHVLEIKKNGSLDVHLEKVNIPKKVKA